MSYSTVVNMMILAPLILQLICLTIAVMIDPYVKRRHRATMLIITELILSLVLQGQLEYNLQIRPDPPLRTLVAAYGYCARPFIIVLFLRVVALERKHYIPWALAILNFIVYLVSCYTGIAFSISADNVFSRGPLGYTCHIISGILVAMLVVQSVENKRGSGAGGIMIPIVNVIIIVLSVGMDFFVGPDIVPASFLTISMVSVAVFYYIWLHHQFVHDHEQALMAEQRIRIMISQIQPHFLFNTLSTIQALCRIDPEKAFDTTEKFGTYLRKNLDSLNRSDLIPLSQELEHTKIYAEIEMIRFPRIRVEYFIEDEDFRVPALTVQPLVENAIRHGVRGKADGRVVVATREVPGGHEIMIRDNGTGFDAGQINQLESTHIGLRNVRERIATMCGGEMKISSVRDKGTTIILSIPE